MTAMTITFDTDNAAFCDDNGPEEAAAILRQLAKQVSDGFTSGLITDSNGNRVGSWSVDFPTARTEP